MICMKKRFFFLLIAAFICCAVCVPAAFANSWNLKGPLLNAVSGTHRFDDYSAKVSFYEKNVPVSAAVMESRDHSVLLVSGKNAAGKETLWESTTAVYPPDWSELPEIDCTADSVTLSWPGYLRSFIFSWDNHEDTWVLTQADCGDDKLTLQEGIYVTGEGNIWQADPVTLESFNIRLFPDDDYDILYMNRIYAATGNATEFLHEEVTVPGKTKIPVYSAPDEKSYRAAGGKASVSGNEPFWLLASMNHWNMVEYEVSAGTHRIGWIRDQEAPLTQNAPVMLTDVPVPAVEYMTDDPFRGQAQFFAGDDLTDIHLLAPAGPFYVYARARLADGKEVRGFVPVRKCALPEEKISLESMNALCGTWAFYHGGNIQSDILKLLPDGTCEFRNLTEEASPDELYPDKGLSPEMIAPDEGLDGTWYVTESTALDMECAYTLVLRTKGTVKQYGILTLAEKDKDGRICLTLVRGETGGTWALTEKDDTPVNVSPIEMTYTDPAGEIGTSGFGYDRLDESWKPFFPRETWGNARFLTYPDYDHWSEYTEENYGKPYTVYPIVTVLDGGVQLHVFSRDGSGIEKIMETRPDTGMTEENGRKASAPIYTFGDSVSEDGVRHYRETINLYLDNERDPWNIQIVLERTDPDDSKAYYVSTVVYQYMQPGKTKIRGQKYDRLAICPEKGRLVYSYSYEEADITDSLVIPLTGGLRLDEFKLSDFPEDPDALLTSSRVDTKKHGKGNTVKMRRTPEKNGKVLGEIRHGAKVDMVEAGDGWCFVKYKNQYGYVKSEYIEGTSDYYGNSISPGS